MDIDKKTKYGVINITGDAIAQVAGNAAITPIITIRRGRCSTK